MCEKITDPATSLLTPGLLSSAQSSCENGSAGSRRRKLWNLPGSCHCLIIGTCLTLDEVKTLCKKCACPTADKSDYQLHQFFVSQASHADSIVARRTNKLLEKKFKIDISRVRAAKNPADLLDHWQVLKEVGQIPGTLWAIVTHPACNSEVVELLYGEVHMMSHLSGASMHQTAAKLAAMKVEIEALKEKLKSSEIAWARKIDSARQQITRLKNNNRELRLKSTGKAPQAPDTIAREETKIHRAMLRETNAQLRSIKLKLRDTQQLADTYRHQATQKECDIDKLEHMINHLIGKDSADTDNCDQSLSGKCVLLLGGRPSQCKHFKAYVESNNGDFLHHDGGVESSYTQIDQLVGRADAVLCPVEQVSHTAMQRARKLCRKSDKPLVFLHRSSLAAFVTGIREIPAGQTTASN